MASDLALKRHTAELAGLDALETAVGTERSRGARFWSAAWPKLAAISLAILIWQIVVWSGWRESYVLPGPAAVFGELADRVGTSSYWKAIGVTMTRGVIGFTIATVIGLILGIAVARVRPLRTAVGSMITGLQTMPSIAWFPLAILLFQLSEKAILFVIVLGAAPSVANGVISGVDYVPTLLLRAGRNMGARGMALYRYVVLPAALPSLVAGLKQGWAFAWRSLMAGELLVIIAERPSLGVHLQLSREFGETEYMIGLMLTILVIGILVDSCFGAADRAIRRRWGVLDNTA
jgi:NitT/TauT family transport system permease protein